MPERLREARGGASDALVGRFRFFLLIVRTLSGSATICGSEKKVAKWGMSGRFGGIHDVGRDVRFPCRRRT